MAEQIFGETTTRILSDIGQMGLWLQTLGIVVVLWLIFEVASLIYHHRRMKEVYKIKEDMTRIEGKIDRILSAKRK